MSTHPRLEARISALERRQTNLETRVEEVTDDTNSSIKNLSEDMIASFKQTLEYLDKIETTTATKEDLVAMETRILNAFKQMLTMINPQNPPSQ